MDDLECSAILKALSDPTRLKIFRILQSGKTCGCKILENLNISQPTLSHHMSVLCKCNIVIAEKQWKWNYYSINFDKLTKLTDYLTTKTSSAY